MTKYRTISDGYAKHLQYLHERKFLFFFVIKEWRYIWWPYYDRLYGRSLDSCGYDTYVCNYNNNLNEFPKRWPDIKEYFEWADKKQKQIESIEDKKQAEINKNKGVVEYL